MPLGRRVVQGGLGIDRGICGAGYPARGGGLFFPLSRELGCRGIRRAISAVFVAWGRLGERQTREEFFFFINRRTDCSCISGPVESTREFVVKFYSIAGGITMCESDCRRNWSVSLPWIGVQSSIISSCCSCRVGISVAPR